MVSQEDRAMRDKKAYQVFREEKARKVLLVKPDLT